MTTRTASILDITDPTEAIAAIDALAPGVRQKLDRSLRNALRGQRGAVHRYVSAYRDLTLRLLHEAQRERPDLVTQDAAGHYRVVDESGACSSSVELILESHAAQAPFSPWVTLAGLQDGVVLEILSWTRSLLGDATPLSPPAQIASPANTPTSRVTMQPADVSRFLRLVSLELAEEQPPLWRVRDTFDLNDTELGRLFGVSRQAAHGWLVHAPPASRTEKVATLAAIADTLARHLKAGRIPGIARKRAPAYGDKTMLELIADDRHEWLLESVRGSFDYAATA